MTATSPTHVLLASSPYSASTLVSHLLGAHPQIATVSDVSGTRREHRMQSFACSCGRLMRDCPFWKRVHEAMRLAGYDDFRLANFELGFDPPGHRGLTRVRIGSMRWNALEEFRDLLFRSWPGNESTMRRIGRRNRAFAAAVAGIQGGTAFVDASKERLRARYLRRYVDPDLRVIHLVRDVRGVVASARGHASQARASVERLAHDWKRTNDALDRVGRQGGARRHMLMRYEDLCRDPAGVLARAYALCGVDALSDMPLPEPQQHLLGNRVRLAAVDEITLDERWRTTLSRDDESRVLAIAGGTLDRLYAGIPE